MSYIEPKTDWKVGDGVDNDDFNRIEGNTKFLKEVIDDKFPNSAGAKNSIYSGEFLGTALTAEQKQSIQDGSFSAFKGVGGYWTINGVNWRVAGFNYYRRSGDVELTANHITIVPDTMLYFYVMNDTNTTDGGYVGSKMYNAGLTEARAAAKSAFPGSVVNHRQLLCNAVAEGEASGWAWYDSEVELMNEAMVYGGNIFGTSKLGGGSGYNAGLGKSQLPLFSLRPDLISNRQTFWFRDVVSASRFAGVSNGGSANASSASNAGGVRPAFSIS